MDNGTVAARTTDVKTVSVSTARRRAALYGLRMRKDKNEQWLYRLYRYVRVHDRRKGRVTHYAEEITNPKTPAQIVALILEFDIAVATVGHAAHR
jgi:hypothetical protein